MQPGKELGSRSQTECPESPPSEASDPSRVSDDQLENSTWDVASLGAYTAYPPIVIDASDNRVLRDVGGLKDFVAVGDMNEPFLSGLERQRPPSTANHTISFIEVNAEKVVLDVKDIAGIDVPLLSACKAGISLIVHETGDLNKLDKLREIKNLTELKFVGFEVSTFPLWVEFLPHLTALSFDGYMLAVNDRKGIEELKSKQLLPKSVSRLELSCVVHPVLINSFLSHREHLTELAITMNGIPDGLDLNVLSCLRVLKLFASKDLDGEVLERVSLLKSLETLHLSGCLNLTAAHLYFLTDLPSLKELCVSCSRFSRHALEALASMKSLSTLKLYSCLGISLTSMLQMPKLKTIRLIDCMGPKDELPLLLQHLLHLHLFKNITE